MTSCATVEPLLGACLDRELDLTTALTVEDHLATCLDCGAQYERLRALHDEIADADLDWSASVDLARVRRIVAPSEASAPPDPKDWWAFGGWGAKAALAAASVLALAILLPRVIGPNAADAGRELADAHIRALRSDRLVEVQSDDRHNVKPWFQGKLGFSPPVPDLSSRGFTLVGGRVDAIGGTLAAGLVYKRREHIVDVLIAPTGRTSLHASELGGYNMLQWESNGMSLYAVSDLNAAELGEFQRAFSETP